MDMIKKLGDLYKLREIMTAANQPVPTPLPFLEPLVRQFVTLYDPRVDADRLQKMAALLVGSCRSPVAEVRDNTVRRRVCG